MKNIYRSLCFLLAMALVSVGFSPVNAKALPSLNSLVLGSGTDVVLERTAVAVDSGITATFEGTVTKLTVSVTNGVNGDTLYAPNHPGCSFDGLGYTLSCFGTFTDDDVTAILRDVMFDSLSSDVTARTIEFWVGTSIIPYEVEPGVYHYYEYIPDNLSWSNAFAAAAARSFEGMTGYLATVTTAGENAFISTKLGNNAWLGGTDDYHYINTALGSTVYADQGESEGLWYWVSGPDAGTRISNGNGSPVAVDGAYTAWAGGEPNNAGGEHYLEIYVSDQKWNDLPDSSYGFGYVVEYSGGTDVNLISLTATKTLIFEPTVVRYVVEDSDATGTVPLDMTSYEVGDTVTVLGNPGNLSIEGGAFVGWADGMNTYVAGDTFEFTGRTVLRAVFAELSMNENPLYVYNDASEYNIDNGIYYDGAWASKFTVQITNHKTGDFLSFDKADGTYRYNIGEYVYYTMASVYDEASATLTITTSIPIPDWQIENYLNNHTYFGSDGEEGDRTLKISVYRNADSVLISAQRIMRVYDGFTVTYQTGDGYSVDADPSIYMFEDWFDVNSAYDLDDDHRHFLFWLDQYQRPWVARSSMMITTDLVLTPVFAETLRDTIGLTDILPSLPQISGMESFINDHLGSYNNYEAWKVFFSVYGLSLADLDEDEWDAFKEYLDDAYPLNDHLYYLMDVRLWIAYWSASDQMPGVDQFEYLTGSDDEPYMVTITLTIPEALRGKSDYKIVRIHDNIVTVLTVIVNKTNWTISFETDRFSTYVITYAEPQDLPDTGVAADIAWILVLGAVVLLSVSRKVKKA